MLVVTEAAQSGDFTAPRKVCFCVSQRLASREKQFRKQSTDSVDRGLISPAGGGISSGDT